ncbi:hypothetical protein EKL28_16235 [Staphylococcus aureus]|nr:hypothetical protein EKL28_16235 [Staphylococcus aureus]
MSGVRQAYRKREDVVMNDATKLIANEAKSIVQAHLDRLGEAEMTIRVDLGRGTAKDTVYTCDLSYDYVRINADYRS